MLFIKFSFKFLFLVFIALLFYSYKSTNDFVLGKNEEIQQWENELNELNYIVIRISAINLINGLNLSKEQIIKLKLLQDEVEKISHIPQNKNKPLVPEITQIKETYKILSEKLIKKEKISEDFKKEVFDIRIIHSLLIKKTLHGKTKAKKTENSCIKCHALPRDFPKDNIEEKKNRKIYAFQRYKIDKSHALGMLSKDVNLKVWYAKDNVDLILTNAQKSIVKGFTCCLLPPGDLSDPMRAGQAFSTDDWLKFFRDIREVDKRTWQKYKHLYMKPLESLIIASLPSITELQKNQSLHKMEKLLMKIRKMNDIQFELEKEALILQFESCYNFDNITGVNRRSKKIELYVTSMYLLFPGIGELYDELLKNQ